MPPWHDMDAVPRQDTAPSVCGDDALARAAARCLTGEDGRRLMAWLCRRTLERALAPEAGAAALWALEGQRSLVLALISLVRRGGGHPPDSVDALTPASF